MNGFYISVANGLLSKDHRERMGSAVWEFMWCLDKITMVKDGIGYVLGGKPINLSDLAEQLGVTEMTVSRNLERLEEWGYIKKLRTPYGIVIKVMKAKKRFNKNVGSIGLNKNVESRNENVDSNKIVSVDSNSIDIVADGNENIFSYEDELEKLRNGGKKGDRNDFKVIALYWKRKGWKFENRKQFSAALARELRPAKALTGYTGKQVGAAINFCIQKFPEMWTLETVHKRITDIVNK